ncbi:4751_t:CDS:2 [Scutellospora calospora]|uniref:4751_t:CDS:1 n=1 Tax=Scutellospora calospora TaxID=85575 RepID=A0ACA9JVU6_9GLOM|nr:4751_t:CDS:2 [Scutellospora calospora]
MPSLIKKKKNDLLLLKTDELETVEEKITAKTATKYLEIHKRPLYIVDAVINSQNKCNYSTERQCYYRYRNLLRLNN